MISVDWTLGLQFINFVILLIILNKLLYKPLKENMEKRRNTIDGSHARAKDLEADIEEKMQRYQQQLNEAKVLATEERNKLKKLAGEEEAKIVADAHGKANDRLQAIKGQVSDEASEAGKVLKAEAEQLAEQIATKILGRKLA